MSSDQSPADAVADAGRRAPRFRGAAGLIVLAVAVAVQGLNWLLWNEDFTFRTFFAVYVFLPATALALLVWWTFFSGLEWAARGVGLAAAAAAAGLFFACVRIDGVDGVMMPKLSFRWTKPAEQRAREFFAAQASRPPGPAANGNGEVKSGVADRLSPDPARSPDRLNAEAIGVLPPDLEAPERVEVTEQDWPRFRGANHDGIVRGVALRSDWASNPPREVWRHPCGLGWSSFAVVGTRLFTQEQLDQDEAVVCYDAASGRELWRHTDRVRLDTSLGGDGPRGTPTVYDSKVYSLGGTGLLNCLDAATGRRIWVADILQDAGIDGIGDAKIDWGMAGSPLVDEQRVYVCPGIGKSRPRPEAVAAYDRLTGRKLWAAGQNRAGYAAPLPAVLDGMRQIVIFDAAECAGYDPETGRKLWFQPFANNQGINVAQPIPVGPKSLVISAGYGAGAMRFDVSRAGDEWSVIETWRLRNQFKLKFNDGVLRNGFIYGLDEGILACVDVETGVRQWRQGRYRYGEIVLVAGDSPADDLLVVISESGELVLVRPSPEKPTELGKFKAIRGTCWNHPVVNRGRIYLRSEEEMACFDASSPSP